MRRALIVALVVAAAAPGSAGAQDRTPVVGGGSFLSAPLLEGGRYSDTLLPGERLYYGVRLEPGQQLRLRGELDITGGRYNEYANAFALGIQTPLREVVVLDAIDDDIAGNGDLAVDLDQRLEYITPPVLTKSGADEESGVYRGPGTWYVSLYLTTDDERPRRVEFPVELDIEVLGEPQPDPDPEPTPARTPAPSSPDHSDDGGTSIAAVLGLGAAGLVVGLVGGAVAGAATRRRRP